MWNERSRVRVLSSDRGRDEERIALHECNDDNDDAVANSVGLSV
jgi:hypothetical protein